MFKSYKTFENRKNQTYADILTKKQTQLNTKQQQHEQEINTIHTQQQNNKKLQTRQPKQTQKTENEEMVGFHKQLLTIIQMQQIEHKIQTHNQKTKSKL